MGIIESQFDVASNSGSDHLSDGSASEDSGDEVCESLTSIYSVFLQYNLLYAGSAV